MSERIRKPGSDAADLARRMAALADVPQVDASHVLDTWPNADREAEATAQIQAATEALAIKQGRRPRPYDSYLATGIGQIVRECIEEDSNRELTR